MSHAPCRNTPNRAFSNPTKASPQAVRFAIKMCQACPLIKECAQAALTSGTSLAEDHRAPANDVIQAGVHCVGDYDTAVKLASIAGVEVPAWLSERHTRATPGDRCRGCGNPMVKWNRYEKQPEGYVRHYARGWGECCRSEHSKWKKQNPSAPRGLRKQVDRKRHSSPKKKAGQMIIQPGLFDMKELISG